MFYVSYFYSLLLCLNIEHPAFHLHLDWRSDFSTAYGFWASFEFPFVLDFIWHLEQAQAFCGTTGGLHSTSRLNVMVYTLASPNHDLERPSSSSLVLHTIHWCTL